MQIRDYTVADFAAATALWAECGLHPSPTDTPQALAEVARCNPGLFLLAFAGETLVASVMGTWDGRRGWINRLAVAPGHRGQGLGRRMLELAESRLAGRGCRKVNLLVEPDNRDVTRFYAAGGYAEDKLVFLEKWLPAQG